MKKKYIFFAAIFLFVGVARAQSFKFGFMSDSRGSDNGVNTKVLRTLTNHMLINNPDLKFILFAGDLIDGTWDDAKENYSQLLHWKEIMSPAFESDKLIGAKVYVVPGNHEIRTRFDEDNFRKVFPDMPQNGPAGEKGLTYSFDYGGCHFVMIDNDRWDYGDPKDTSDDKRDWHKIKSLEWVKKDIEQAVKNGAKRIFAAGHEMAFPVSYHIHDGLPNLGKNITLPLNERQIKSMAERDEFWNYLSEAKASAYFCGHEHLYAREKVKGVWQIIGGSSGAPGSSTAKTE